MRVNMITNAGVLVRGFSLRENALFKSALVRGANGHVLRATQTRSSSARTFAERTSTYMANLYERIADATA